MGQGSEYGKEEEEEEGAGAEMGGREGRGAAENSSDVLLTSGLEKSFLTVTQNEPQEKTAWKTWPCNFSVSHREKHY